MYDKSKNQCPITPERIVRFLMHKNHLIETSTCLILNSVPHFCTCRITPTHRQIPKYMPHSEVIYNHVRSA